MIFQFLIICFLIESVSPAVQIDQSTIKECLPEMQQYLYCAKQEVRYHAKIVGVEVSNSFKKKVDDCFKNVKCPRYPSKEPTIESHFKGKDLENWNKFRVFIENLETPKRQCLVRAVGDSYRKVFVDCLNQFKLGIHAQPLEDKVSLDGNILKLLNERAYWRTMVSDSFHDCEKHEDAAKCIIELRHTEFNQSCAIRNHCAVIDDDAGFNDCVVACYTLSNKCRDLLINIREDVCRCNVDKRKELLTVGQRHVNQTSQFGLKANQVAQIILYGEEPKGQLSNEIEKCGLNVPLLKEKAKISFDLSRYILLYIDGYAPRDVVYCHNCGDKHV